jgi:hypothetical protein
MLLITLAKNPRDCQVELDGQDVSKRLCRIQVDADVTGGSGVSYIVLTLIDDVTIIGEAGKLEFRTRENHD